MIRHVMVATDGSHLCELALDQAAELAGCLNARLSVLHVIPDADVPLGAAEGYAFDILAEQDTMRQEGRHVLAQAMQRLDGVQAEGVLREANGQRVADVIVDTADELGVDLIVMSTHCRKGIQRLLAGSTAESVLHHARQPVLLTHEAPPRRAPRQATAS